MSDPELSVLIPAHNEEKRIRPCLRQLSAFLKLNCPSSEIVVSEDGSKDRTLPNVREFSETTGIPVSLLHFSERLGKGGGLKRGIQAARGRYTVFADTDLPVPLETIKRAVQMLKAGADVVVGSRIIEGSSRDEPMVRRTLSYGFHALAWLLLGVSCDSQCGFKAVRTSVGRKAFALMVSPGFAYDVEFLVQAKRVGAKIVELPVRWHYRRYSSVRLPRDVVRMFNELLQIFVRLRLRQPIGHT